MDLQLTGKLVLARDLAETTPGTGVTVNSILAGPTLSEGVDGFVNWGHYTKRRK
ncbi:MAG TPA: hypothetical protein VE201_10130 [Nitrospirales bacterium]|nr:hypothetical protein [Nitrospirales bacterium]